MKINSMRTENDYRAGLKLIDELIAIDPKEGTPAFDEIDFVSSLVESYESIHYPITAPPSVS
jgi:HTH-type transcriptional regulator/antitoxin HigA